MDDGERARRGVDRKPRQTDGRAHLAAVEFGGVRAGSGRQRGVETERQAVNSGAEIVAGGAVPGVDFVKRFEAGENGLGREHAYAIEPGGADGAGAIGKAGQRDIGFGAPQFGVVRLQEFERGKRKQEIADGAGADEEPFHERESYTRSNDSMMATHAGRPVRTTSGLLDNIGNTPLIRLARVTRDLPGIEIYGKAEYFNPGGSVKDRPAARMIAEGERSGALTAGKILIDSTSGNTGIAYAMIAAAKGIPVRLCLPRNASEERKRILKAYGAEIVFTDPGEGSDGAIRKCREIYNADPDRYFYPDQYNNPANWQAHFDGTGPEILEQTDGRLTHFVAALGTSGTFMGTTRYLRKHKPSVECISAQPSTGFHGLEGLKYMPTAIVPGIYDASLADRNLWLETEDAHRMVKQLAREEGLLVGVSAGGNVCGALQIGRELVAQGRSGVIVTILCDSADKYLSEAFWDEPESF